MVHSGFCKQWGNMLRSYSYPRVPNSMMFFMSAIWRSTLAIKQFPTHHYLSSLHRAN
jgi:hypothetical protein